MEGCRILCHRLREAGFDGGAEIVELAISSTPEEPNAQAALARFLYEEGRIKEAEQFLIRVIESQPDHTSAKRTLCDIFGETANFQEALKLLGQLVSQPGASSTLFVERAILLRRLGDPIARSALAEAIKRQESAVKMNPLFVHDRLLLAYLRHLNDQPEESRAGFEESLRLLPESSDGPLLLKRVLKHRNFEHFHSSKYARIPLYLFARLSKLGWLHRLFLKTAPRQIRSLRFLTR